MIPLIDKVTENQDYFAQKVELISKKLNVPPAWLMFVMWFESKLNHKAVNPYSNATGLIQFMPSTAVGLGTSVNELKQMSNVDQLSFVYKYLAPFKSKLKSFQDLYLSVFFPVAVGKPDDFVLQTSKLSAETIAKANPVFDLDNNKSITVAEIKQALLARMPLSIRTIIEAIKKKPISLIIPLAIITYFILKK